MSNEMLQGNPNMQLGGLTAPYYEDLSKQVVKELIGWKITDQGYELYVLTNAGETATLILSFFEERLLRMTLVPQHETFDAPGQSILVKKLPAAAVEVTTHEDESRLILSSAYLSVQVKKKPWSLALYNQNNELIWQESQEDTNIKYKPRVSTLGYKRNENGAVESVFEAAWIAPNESFYGHGEKFMPIDHRGSKLKSWNFNTWGATVEKAYKNIPFFLSSKGYGLFLNTHYEIDYDMGSGDQSLVSYTLEIKDKCMDLFFIYGPEFSEILDVYTDLTGKAPVPPKWSFGLWMSRYGYRSREELEEVADGLRSRSIPSDVLHLDPYWLRPRMYADLIWDEESFPAPEQMIAELKQKGFKICLWIQPWIPEESEVYAEADALGHFAKDSEGNNYRYVPTIPGDAPCYCGVIDFTSEATRKWYQQKIEGLVKQGVDAIKTDFGEAIPEDAVFYGGKSGKEIHNIYPLYYNQAVYEAMKTRPGGTGLVWGRSGYAGSQNYPIVWGGDIVSNYPSMATTLWGGLSIALSGVPFWSHDIGGFEGSSNPKLYIRWAQFGLLSSHSRCHGTEPREPWVFGDQVLAIFKKYTELRYQLLPYLYSYAFVASQTGMPLMRPMILEFQNDPVARKVDLQYMLGRELLVAPVFSDDDFVELYLPEGKWLDHWTGEVLQGGKYITYQAAIDVIPLFIREDSIIPFGPVRESISDTTNFIEDLNFKVFLSKEAKFTVHEQEGALNVHVDVVGELINIQLAGSLPSHMSFDIHVQSQISKVQLNGNILELNGTDGYAYSLNPTKHTVHVYNASAPNG